jgi:hypothetical protein
VFNKPTINRIKKISPLQKSKDILRDSYTIPSNCPSSSFWTLAWRTLRYRAALAQLPLTQNERLLNTYRNAYQGERAFIIGNGPSLTKCNLHLLKDEITFGVNSIFLHEDNMGFRPSYYVVEDVFVAEDRAEQINSYHGPVKFFGNYLNYCLEADEKTIWLNIKFDYRDYENFPHFSCNANRSLWVGGTVSYICMQLAYYMGFSKVYLLGFDHSYIIPNDVDRLSTTELKSVSKDPNHFHTDYFGKGYRWHTPQTERMEKCYRKAKCIFEANGRKIYNATIGGKLEVFERVNYTELFNN